MEPIFRQYDPFQCLNCDIQLTGKEQFCPNCGQRNRQHKRSILEWIGQGISSFFHFEGKSWNTLRDLFIPGLVAKNYLDGKRKRYVHPVRLLLLSSLLFFGAISLLEDFEILNVSDSVVKVGDNDSGDEESVPTINIVVDSENVHKLLDTAISIPNAGEEFVKGFLDGATGSEAEALEEAVQIESEGSSPNLNIEFNEERVEWNHKLERDMRMVDVLRARIMAHDAYQATIDSFRADFPLLGPEALALEARFETNFAPPQQSINLNIGPKEYQITPTLLATKSPSQIANQLAPNKIINNLVVRKVVQSVQDGIESFNNYLFQNLSWAILLFVPMLAVGYWMFYPKRFKYYSQALSFTAFNASALLLFFAIVIVAINLFKFKALLPIAFPGAVLYLILSERHALQYKTWKVLVKSIGIAFFSMITFLLAFSIWILLAIVLI